MSAAAPTATPAHIYGLLDPFGYGRGRARPIPLAAVAAGAQLATVKVPGAAFWRIKTAALQLVTSAVVANRLVFVDMRDADGNVLFRNAAPAVQAATLTTRYSFGLGYEAGLSPAGAQTAPLVGLFLEPGYQVVVSVSALDVGDAITAAVLVVEEFPTGDEGYPLGAVPAALTIPAT